MHRFGTLQARTGRLRAFDTQQALARACDLFWSRGYAATSVQGLVDGLGVQRGSLYAGFGDKHDLYLKAVALYARENREQLEASLRDGPVLPTLRGMLLEPSVPLPDRDALAPAGTARLPGRQHHG